MQAIKTNVAEMEKALCIVNEKYGGNVIWNRFEPKGKRIIFTLRVRNSQGPGHSLGFYPTKSGNLRKLTSACWHVHGDFFDALFTVNKDATIKTARKTITVTGGNWEDWDAGSRMNPQYMSEKCDCEG